MVRCTNREGLQDLKKALIQLAQIWSLLLQNTRNKSQNQQIISLYCKKMNFALFSTELCLWKKEDFSFCMLKWLIAQNVANFHLEIASNFTIIAKKWQITLD